jgi:hypothetical protein
MATPMRLVTTEVKTEWVKITPKMATDWLEANTNNRPVSDRRVSKYAADMKAGHWKRNAETIKFGKSGKLLDGQHRLFACMEAGAPFWSLVAWGVDDDTFDTIDTGAGRTPGDILGIMGETNAHALAAAARWQLMFEEGTIKANGKGVSPHQIREVFERHPALRDCVAPARVATKLIQPGLAIFLYYQLSKKDADRCGEFFEQIGRGVNLTTGSPIYMLRERLIENKASKRKLRPVEVGALTVKAWNMVRRGKSAQVLSWRGSGPGSEAFPVAV